MSGWRRDFVTDQCRYIIRPNIDLTGVELEERRCGCSCGRLFKVMVGSKQRHASILCKEQGFVDDRSAKQKMTRAWVNHDRASFAEMNAKKGRSA